MAWITASDVATFLGHDPATVDVTATGRYGVSATAACDQIERFCDRTFQAADYYRWLDGTGTKYLPLPEYPILNVYLVANNFQAAIAIGNTSTDATEFFVSVAEDGIMTLTVFSGVNAGALTLTLSTYTTMALLVAAIVALGKGWVATVQNEAEPQTMKPDAITVTSTQTAFFYAADSGLWDNVHIEQPEGILYNSFGWARGHQNYFVYWQAGYVTVPPDVTEIAKQLAADLLDASGRGRFLQSEKTGDYSSSLRDAAPITAYKSDLTPYRNFRVSQ